MSVSTGLDSSINELRRRASICTAQANNSMPLDTTEHMTGRSCRTSSLALSGPHERALLDLLDHQQPLLQPINAGHLVPNNNAFPRRHSAHCCPTERPAAMVPTQAPPIPSRAPAVPERNRPGPPMPLNIRINPANPCPNNANAIKPQASVIGVAHAQIPKLSLPHIPVPKILPLSHPPQKMGTANDTNQTVNSAHVQVQQKSTQIMGRLPYNIIGQVPQKVGSGASFTQPGAPSLPQPLARVQPPIPPPHSRQNSKMQIATKSTSNPTNNVVHNPNKGNKLPPVNATPFQNGSIQSANRRPSQISDIQTIGLMQNSNGKPCQIPETTQENSIQNQNITQTVGSTQKTSPVQELPTQIQQNLVQSQSQSQSQAGAVPQNGKISVRQDSNVSSDSFSQNSSPSYTTKTMETPLLPHHANVKSSNSQYNAKAGNKDCLTLDTPNGATEPNGVINAALTKSISTPASLQTIVRFHNGSNMSLHHRIIRDMRRPSTHYITRGRLKFRFAQVLFNAVALLAIAGGLAAYFRAYPSTVRYVNQTVSNLKAVTHSPQPTNPAPGICLPVIVSFCHHHKVPYNFTMFPNYMGHFTQRDAQSELEVYDAVVDVRCYELAALFLCSVFVPKCGPTGQLVRPCRNLCFETKRRCGFFLEVFGLSLPDYLDCDYFPESADNDVCVGYKEVVDAKIRSQKPVCKSGFQCDVRRCIPSDWRCDGHVDCEDQSDELNCKTCANGMIHCGEEKCMAQSHMCDGKPDCPWGQDEKNCLRLSDRMGDEGKGKLEVYHPENRTWQPACIKQWDANHSPLTICSLLGYQVAESSNVTRKGSNVTLAPHHLSSPSVWKLYDHKQPNLLKELRACTEHDHPTVDLACSHYACGKRRQLNSGSSKRIVGGTVSAPGDWPFLAALLGGPEEVFYCAGVLIAEQWVLTASHCVGNQSDPSGWTIQLGITRRHAHSYFGQKMKVKRVVPHPLYNLGVTHDNDVALFQLQHPVTFHEQLLPVCLPPADHELTPGTVCTVIGWGKREDKDASEYEPAVNEVQVPVLNRDLCNSWLQHRDLNVTAGMICAGYAEGGKDACQGDSGGPLLCKDDRDRWFVGGIVSWGIKCAHPNLPGVYAYVPRYVLWIKEQMNRYNGQ